MGKGTEYCELPPGYKELYDAIRQFIDDRRIFCGRFETLQYGVDASFYRILPKLVVKAITPGEISEILRVATELQAPVTFRAAGTSLSGQALSDSVLICLAGAWRGCRIADDASAITLEPGVIGADANYYLAPFGRKIGPDPASINACMIGGIAANNASGMCCGTAENSYKTVESMKLIFVDGAQLDTADPASREKFKETHKLLIDAISCIRDEIRANESLTARIRHKFSIKNTTGYGINSFIDYDDPIDIIMHLMIGSEGTLAFISEITYRTVIEHPHKASSLMVFPNIQLACRTTERLKQGPVSAVELMDRASLRSVEDKPGMPSYLKELSDDAAAILVETRAAAKALVLQQIEEINSLISDIPALFPITFMDRPEDYNKLWNIRKGLFPSVGGARSIGTTVVIEDVVFPIGRLADGAMELQVLMKKHGYPEGIIFGHALEGNLHFVFCPDLNDPDSVKGYQNLVDEVCEMVTKKYDGSLKGEHGTGRNMAPFVEMEWGTQAYSYMKRLKQAFDPDNLLNPGVIINDNPQVYVENLKPMPAVSDIVDKCIECGFCEQICPSKNITMTPRHRIVAQREIARLRASHEDEELLKRFIGDYRYPGERTCATDGLCATVCPVSIDTGDLTKRIRSNQKTEKGAKIAGWCADNYAFVLLLARTGLKIANAAHAILGTALMERISGGLRDISGGLIPLWNRWMPKGISKPEFSNITKGLGKKVVYFPSCVVRTMGPAKSDPDQRKVYEAMLSILDKSGYDVVFPKNMESLCCGMPFESKGFFEQSDKLNKELESELRSCSNNGEFPIICETSPCLYTMKKKFDPGLKLYQSAEFILDRLTERLHFEKVTGTFALHITCSSVKMGDAEKMKTLAGLCAEKVIVPYGIACCGFAGDRGFTFPELNQSALADLKSALPADTQAGYSSSRACEIGLSLHSGMPYQSILYLVDKCTQRK